MHKLNFSVLFLTLFSVTSCIDAGPHNRVPEIPRHQKTINSWIGDPVTKMIAEWGAPDRVFTTGGKEYHVHENTYQRSYSSQYGGGHSYEYVGCTWTFEIKNGIIVGGTASGRSCDDKK